MKVCMNRFLGWRDDNERSEIVVEMKRFIEIDERTTKGRDNEGSDSRSWIGRWNCTHNNNHHTLCNTYYSLITMPWDIRMSLVGWVYLFHSVTDEMERENTKSSHRINMESFPLSDETRQNYGPIDGWIEWYRCIFALKEVCENLVGGGVDEKSVFWRMGKEQANWVISWLAKMCGMFAERNEEPWVILTW